MECLLCLELNQDLVEYIDISSDKWREQQVLPLIEKHLWPMGTLKSKSPWLCSACWKALHEFNEFYRRIEDANFYYEHIVKSEHIIEIEECKVTDYIPDCLVETNAECETVIRSDNSDSDTLSNHGNQNDVQENCFKNTHYSSSNSTLGRTTKYISREIDESMSNSNTKTFKCNYCRKILKDQGLLLKHIAWHKGNVVSCEICDLKFVDMSELIQHKKIHILKNIAMYNTDDIHPDENTGSFVSFSCEGQENMETEMEQDKLKCTYECKYCYKVLEDQRLLSNHIAWHEGNIYCCEICDLQFFDLDKFETHRSAHKMKRRMQYSKELTSKSHIVSYEPKIEEVESDTRSGTVINLKINPQLKNFECKYCPNVYEHEQVYLNHMAWHEGNIFHCDICDLKFFDASKYYKHKTTHASKISSSCDSNSDVGDLIEEIQEDAGHLVQEKSNHIELKWEVEAHDNASNTQSNTSINSNCDIKMDEEVECNLCSKVLKNERVLLKHTAWHEGNIFHCDLCELKFFNKSTFENHQLAHATSNDVPDNDSGDNIELEYFACKYCSKIFNNRRLLLNHNAWHVGNIQQCAVCDLKFLDKNKFDSHLETHLPNSWKRCRECGKAFACLYQVKRHRDTVHRNIAKVHICDVCGQSYRCPVSFKRHMNRHNGVPEPKLPCNICGRLLTGKLSLKSHQLINHPKGGILPYACDICLKPLATRAKLKRHIVLFHTSSSFGHDHKCPVCNKSFKNLAQLKHHSVIHAPEPKYTCPWCPEKFFVSTRLSRHRKKVHPKEYEIWKRNFYVQI